VLFSRGRVRPRVCYRPRQTPVWQCQQGQKDHEGLRPGQGSLRRPLRSKSPHAVRRRSHSRSYPSQRPPNCSPCSSWRSRWPWRTWSRWTRSWWKTRIGGMTLCGSCFGTLVYDRQRMKAHEYPTTGKAIKTSQKVLKIYRGRSLQCWQPGGSYILPPYPPET